MQILNLTNADVAIIINGGGRLFVPRSGMEARISVETIETKIVEVLGLSGRCEVEIASQRPGKVTGLPGELKGTLYLVTADVLAAVCHFRSDVVVVGERGLVRSAAGYL
jgi:hypothetical protein